jgi:hypothetical protein
MSVDTTCYLDIGSYYDVFKLIKEKIDPTVKISSLTSTEKFPKYHFMFAFDFRYDGADRSMSVHSGSDERTWLKLGAYGKSVEIIKMLTRHFGGELTEIDSGPGETKLYHVKKTIEYKLEKDMTYIWNFLIDKDKYFVRDTNFDLSGKKDKRKLVENILSWNET